MSAPEPRRTRYGPSNPPSPNAGPGVAVYGPRVDRLGVIIRPQRSVDVRERAMQKLRHDRQSRLVFLYRLALRDDRTAARAAQEPITNRLGPRRSAGLWTAAR